MKAVYYQESGRFTVGRGEIRIPGPGEVRLDVAYCGLCGTDLHIAHGSAVNPSESDLAQAVDDATSGAGADVVFEVSGSASGAMAMTKLAGLRARIVVVAIFSVPPAVNLFDVFWKELEVLGTRVYEPEDYDTAIGLIVGRHLPLADLITSVEPLERLPAALDSSSATPRP